MTGGEGHPRKEDHPRGCGEKNLKAPRDILATGSSPRVRGKDHFVEKSLLLGRIIPAGAGKSTMSRRPGIAERDHPRGCGEKYDVSASRHCGEGSSPRVRGKAFEGYVTTAFPRIIPAGAGKSTSWDWTPPRKWDHPRGCGEKIDPKCPAQRKAGSSPRVRGKGAAWLKTHVRRRIIPAGAGKRRMRRRGRGCTRDHPRGCGEKSVAACATCLSAGSSPRVRGKVGSGMSSGKACRIIPAGAGKRCERGFCA